MCARACDLLDLGDGDGDASEAAISLLHGVEYDAADVEVEPHADSIAGHEHVVAAAWVVEQPRLRAPHLWG